MPPRARLTLNQVFLLTLVGLLILLSLLFSVLFYGTSQSILQSSERLRREVGARLANQILSFRAQAEMVAGSVQSDMQADLIHVYDQDGLETALYELVLNHPDIAEVTFTHADSITNDSGIQIEPGNHWQVSAYRSLDSLGRIVTRRVRQGSGGQIVVTCQDGTCLTTQTYQAGQNDPTNHRTFTTPVELNLDRPIWTDLHHSELAGPEGGTDRIEVTVMQVVRGAGGGFLGVVRVGLLEEQLNQIVAESGSAAMDDAGEAGNPIHHTCFLCDLQGRLITPVTPRDYLAVSPGSDDLRIVSPGMPPQIAAALAKVGDTSGGGEITAAGTKYLVTFVPLMHHTQDWVLGVLAPENEYFGKLIETRKQLLEAAAVVIVVILIGGVLTKQALQSGLSRLLNVTARMQKLDFAAVDSMAPFRDVQRVLDSLEQAKTAIRAMGKYVPMELVRDQYEMNREPVLGGEIRELSIMFTDIAGFTTVAETLDPDMLAHGLGDYFSAMAAAIHDHSGTIDKFIGDAVMAIWNAPRPCESHAIKACAAALACTQAARKLFDAAAKQGMTALHMRCGLNRDRVIVGNFGAPDRINYTALGDGVNLASRLESLNKVYGTAIIVSESIHQEASATFCFRLLDRVAVVGKRQDVKIYELRESPADEAAKYESALSMYWIRDFTAALAILEMQPGDPPSAVLAERCRAFITQPPPPEWDGVFRAMMK